MDYENKMTFLKQENNSNIESGIFARVTFLGSDKTYTGKASYQDVVGP